MKKSYVSPRTDIFEVRCANIVAVSIFPNENADPNLPVGVKGYGLDGSETLKTRNLWDEEW